MYKLIIIEDEKSIREELVLLLTNGGYNLIAVEDFGNIVEQILAYSPT